MVMGDNEKARDSLDNGKKNKPVAAEATKAWSSGTGGRQRGDNFGLLIAGDYSRGGIGSRDKPSSGSIKPDVQGRIQASISRKILG